MLRTIDICESQRTLFLLLLILQVLVIALWYRLCIISIFDLLLDIGRDSIFSLLWFFFKFSQLYFKIIKIIGSFHFEFCNFYFNTFIPFLEFLWCNSLEIYIIFRDNFNFFLMYILIKEFVFVMFFLLMRNVQLYLQLPP